MTHQTKHTKGKEKKTVESLDMFIRMTILGLEANMINSYARTIGKEIKKLYEERYGEL